jgi:hypothetical protein
MWDTKNISLKKISILIENLLQILLLILLLLSATMQALFPVSCHQTVVLLEIQFISIEVSQTITAADQHALEQWFSTFYASRTPWKCVCNWHTLCIDRQNYSNNITMGIK